MILTSEIMILIGEIMILTGEKCYLRTGYVNQPGIIPSLCYYKLCVYVNILQFLL